MNIIIKALPIFHSETAQFGQDVYIVKLSLEISEVIREIYSGKFIK